MVCASTEKNWGGKWDMGAGYTQVKACMSMTEY